MQLNWLVILLNSFVPLLVGAVYYNKMFFGGAAQSAAGPSSAAKNHPAMVYIFSLLMSVLLAVFMMPIVMHANHLYSLIAMRDYDPGTASTAQQDVAAFMAKYGSNFRTFKHGAFHGLLTAIFGVWPILGIVALFENKGWKYIAVHVGYFAICLMLMGGTICAYA